MYLEDDIRLSFVNFCYFLEYREVLRDTGLLPSFVRVEYCQALNGFVSSDNETPVDVSTRPRIDHGDIVLVNPPLPYTACYILDTTLAREFLRTRSFNRERSRAVTDMFVRERAAMGLCFENVTGTVSVPLRGADRQEHRHGAEPRLGFAFTQQLR